VAGLNLKTEREREKARERERFTFVAELRESNALFMK
jgi:hypothetical protein